MYRISCLYMQGFILCLFSIFNICIGDSEGIQERTVYTQAIIHITKQPNNRDKKYFSGKYGFDSLKERARGFLYYSEKYKDWCKKDLEEPPDGLGDISEWIALIPTGNCSTDEKVRLAKKYNASAVIIYNKGDPINVPVLKDGNKDFVTIAVNGNTGEKFIELIKSESTKNLYCEITVGTHYVDRKEWKVSRTSVLFVLVSFILLMCISLAWLVFYYVQRFRHIYRNDRKEKQLLSAAKKAISKLKTKSHQTGNTDEDDACAICLEGYKNGETLRILPCKHEYHKACIDPWLLNHRTCPMCKTNILKALGVELPDDVNIARHDVEQPTPAPRPTSNQISLVEPSPTPAEPESSVYTSSPVVIPAEAWKDDSACSLSSSSGISSDDTDSERSTMALVSPQRV